MFATMQKLGYNRNVFFIYFLLHCLPADFHVWISENSHAILEKVGI